MRATKLGLADLKRLRQQALEGNQPTPSRPPPQAARKKKGFQQAKPPAADRTPAAPVAGAASTTDTPDSTGLLSDADKALFRQVVKSVQRLPDPNRALLSPRPVAPDHVLKQRRQAATGSEPVPMPQVSDQYAPPGADADPTRFVQAGHGPDLLKKLVRGHWPIGASLDLHGTTLDDARPRLDNFLRSCIEHNIRCVRIIHGKGHGSKDNTPVLKETVRRWLTQLDDVLAYVESPERDGGAGAVLTLLRPGKD